LTGLSRNSGSKPNKNKTYVKFQMQNQMKRRVMGFILFTVIFSLVIGRNAYLYQKGIINADSSQNPQPNIELNIMNYQTHDPIDIDGETELTNFIMNEGFPGNGSYNNPYIIENLFINVTEVNGILIMNTQSYIIIQNCSLLGHAEPVGTNFIHYLIGIRIISDNINISSNIISEFRTGVYISSGYNLIFENNQMYNCSLSIKKEYIQNIEIKDNTVNDKPLIFYKNHPSLNITNESQAGQIILLNCSNAISSNCILSQNVMTKCYKGILLTYVLNFTVFNNSFTENYISVFVRLSDNSTIAQNTFQKGYGGQIYMEGSGNIMISNNVFKFNSMGILSGGYNGDEFFRGSDYCSILQNNFFFNKACLQIGDGIGGRKYSISENNFIENGKGVSSLSSYAGNTFWKNNFINNNVSAISSRGNNWFKDGIGNYWSDYLVQYPNANEGAYIYSEPYDTGDTDVDEYPLRNPISLFLESPVLMDLDDLVYNDFVDLEWNEIENATGYTIYIDNILYRTVDNESLRILFEDSGEFQIQITSTDDIGESIISNAINVKVEVTKEESPIDDQESKISGPNLGLTIYMFIISTGFLILSNRKKKKGRYN